MDIVSVDTRNEKERNELIRYLLPHKTRALFVLETLCSPLQPIHLYAAKKEGAFLGVCSYYPVFQSCSLFTEDKDVALALGRFMEETYHPRTWLGMKNIVQPIYEADFFRGRKSLENVECNFFELSMEDFVPYDSKEGHVRQVSEEDIDEVVMLLRYLHHKSLDAPISEKERIKARTCFIRFGLEIDGKLVCVASSNGLDCKAFQIFGVVTDPKYRGKGYAKAVCSHLIAYMKKLGATEAVLFADWDNEAATKCYKSLGFRITDKYYMVTL